MTTGVVRADNSRDKKARCADEERIYLSREQRKTSTVDDARKRVCVVAKKIEKENKNGK